MKLVTKLSVKRYSAHVNRIWSIIANSMLSLTRSPILDHLYLGPVQYLSNHFLQMKDKSRWQEYLPHTAHSRGKKTQDTLPTCGTEGHTIGPSHLHVGFKLPSCGNWKWKALGFQPRKIIMSCLTHKSIHYLVTSRTLIKLKSYSCNFSFAMIFKICSLSSRICYRALEHSLAESKFQI